MRWLGKAVTPLLVLLAILAAGAAWLDQQRRPAEAAPGVAERFLQQFGLPVQAGPEQFPLRVPATWEVPLGAYPEGLYWGLANEFSRDAGLDLRRLKGKTVTVYRYELAGTLPGEGDHPRFRYPADAIVLVQDQAVVGAWLAAVRQGFGPSVRQRKLPALTGLTFEQWVERERYFTDPGPNPDLSKLGPAQVLAAFLQAVSKGDKTRANACLSPAHLRDTLTLNLPPARLYHPGFGRDNSLVEQIERGKLISYKMADPAHPSTELKRITDQKRVVLAAELQLTWRDAVFNTPKGRTIRFAVLDKTANGWKLSALNTGP